ncbi:MAG: hypothetical protein IPG73_13010 [Ignavibacteria bacterium]|nr:hypothetical protein [Ignavibacteria bacterium]
MKRTNTFIVAITGILLGVVVGNAQPQSGAQVKGCARTLTDQMRNCNGQQPSVKEKSKSGGESAQGREEQETSCNQWALYDYYNCGNLGKAKPVPTIPFTGTVTTPKSTTVVPAKKTATTRSTK